MLENWRYNVGDKVKIIRVIVCGDFVESRYLNKIAIIVEKRDLCYRLNIDDCEYNWFDIELEPYSRLNKLKRILNK